MTKRRKKRSDLSILNEKFHKLYKGWVKVYCRALEADVHFTDKGWKHIQNEKWRTKAEKEERLNYLGTAKFILETATTIQERRLQEYHDSPHTHFGFIAIVGDIKKSNSKFKVVVIEDQGRYDFLSVYKM